LGELCRRFLSIYGKQQKDCLLLDQCTRELGVERRRIYDIINILESFCVIRRQAKNSYEWRGIDKIICSIETKIVSKGSEFELIRKFEFRHKVKRLSKTKCIAMKSPGSAV
jgi:transcription factor E2F7/8